MKVNRVLIIVIICFNFIVSAQKPQKVGYIDMNYILENVPEYVNAQAQLDTKVKTWEQKLDGLSKEIDQMNTELTNEKPLLTEELINEREEDITIKEQEFKRLQQAYFGPTGDLFQIRKQLAEPVQDQVYNAIQDIAKKKKYDYFILNSMENVIGFYWKYGWRFKKNKTHNENRNYKIWSERILKLNNVKTSKRTKGVSYE